MCMETEVRNNNQPLVMIVDDDPSLSKLIRRNLEDTNARVIEVASGLECMRMVHKAKVDLILLDIKLPDFSGWGILSLLRLTEPFHKIPVIIVSVESPITALINQFKPNDYIKKPFDVRDLLGRVGKIIDSLNTSEYVSGGVT